MDTDSLYLALAHENLYDCNRPAKKQEWEALRQQDCNDSFQADAIQNFFPRTYCYKHKKFSSKGLNKRTLEENRDGPIEKYRRVMDEIINLTSTNRGLSAHT